MQPYPDALAAAFRDADASSARREVCAALAAGLGQVGQALQTVGAIVGPGRVDGSSPFGNGNDRHVGLGYVCRIASTLIAGASQLAASGNLYAAAALNRQIVEVEYLAWAFAEDEEEAADWLRSTRDDRMERWQPRQVRERAAGRFRGVDYHRHCELGGHPTPDGARVLLSAVHGAVVAEAMMFETASHGASAWRYVLAGLAQDDGLRALAADLDDAALAHAAVGAWQERDGARGWERLVAEG